MNCRLTLTLLVAAAIALAAPAPATAQRAKAKQANGSQEITAPQVRDKSRGALDSRLLEDLDESPAGPDRTGPDSRQRGAAPRSGPLSEGEDVPSREPADPLMRIGQQMLAAEKRMAAKDASGEAERLQRQILADLDELIKQARQGDGSSQTSNRSRRPGQKGPEQSGAEAGRRDARPSPSGADQAKGPDPSGAGPDGLQDIIDNVWGHLPDRLRKGVLNPSVEEFLPKYESLIERYYRRLAEDEGTQP